MATKRYIKQSKRRKTKKMTQKNRKSGKKGKQWVTAVGAADTVLKQTGSYEKARATLKTQALRNARRLFGSVGEML
jgi:hypothetical protein